MEKTKESLLLELAVIKKSQEDIVLEDEKRRKEFAKAFNWNQEKKYYESEVKSLLPSWEQIFVHIGKLLAGNDFKDLRDYYLALQSKVNFLEEKNIKNIRNGGIERMKVN